MQIAASCEVVPQDWALGGGQACGAAGNMPQARQLTRTPPCGETSIAAVAVTHLDHPLGSPFSQPSPAQRPTDRRPSMGN